MNERLRILLAAGAEGESTVLTATLNALEHEIVQTCRTAADLIALATSQKPDLIVTAVDLPDMDGVSALVEISKSVAVPAIIITPRTSLEIIERAMLDHVMAYLIEPVQEVEIKPTIHLVLRRFEQFQEMQTEVESLRQALADRKFIERAKGILMRRDDIDEDAAYKKLRRIATDARIRMVDAAQQILASEAERSSG
jgi:AmiR/NasT family two-component response regulator